MSLYNTPHHSQYPQSRSIEQSACAGRGQHLQAFRLMTILFALVMVSGSLLPSYAAAADFFGVGLLGGSSNAWGISGDGLVVVGHSQDQAFTWNEVDGIVGLGYLPGFDTASRAHAASHDGSVVVGYSQGGGGQKPFRWTSAGGMVDLGTLGGTFTRANGVSADGSVVVGFSYNDAANTIEEAFYWTQAGGMVGLGDLPGGDTHSEALAVSADGSVVVQSIRQFQYWRSLPLDAGGRHGRPGNAVWYVQQCSPRNFRRWQRHRGKFRWTGLPLDPGRRYGSPAFRQRS